MDKNAALNKQIMNMLNEEQKVLFLKTLMFASKIDHSVDEGELMLRRVYNLIEASIGKKELIGLTVELILMSFAI